MHVNDLVHEDTNHSKTGVERTQSEDPFNIYDILKGQQNNASNSSSAEPKYPLVLPRLTMNTKKMRKK